MYSILLLTYLQKNVLSQAICKQNTIDFSSKNNFSNYLTIDYNSNNAINKNGVLSLRLDKEKGGTRITLKEQLHYGKVDVKMKIAKGSNIVSSFILLAKNGDEIDFEFVQNTNKTNGTDLVQTNYFYRGIPIYDKNAKMYHTKKILSNNFHTYSLKWDPLYYEWYFDNYLLRRLYKNETKNFPDSVSNIQFGIWEAPPSKWAGNGVDWSETPFNLDISSIKISCKNSTNINKEITIPTKTKPTTKSTTKIKTTTQVLDKDISNYPTIISTLVEPTSNSEIKSIVTQGMYITLINLLLILF